MSNTTPNVVILRETVMQSWASDAGTFCTVSGLIGLGVYLESSAMQWAGFVMTFFVIIARAGGKTKRKTPQEAADWLKAEYGVTAGGDDAV